ncbi:MULTISPECIES: mobilization protein [Bacteroidales]|nr:MULTISPECIES: mobilization protein [Bacteroides]MBV3455564.1 mobilization protein [Bacteroides uniformis]MBV3481302.1 mobilization protein [Bacteroides uniformis]MBV3513441.1 mobilization protein [Bacteroides uniformis]MCE9405099.1 mobilization protein [Bacteroides fragilis]MCE9438152.1 mobilization protein [Bacteroides fragilis]
MATKSSIHIKPCNTKSSEVHNRRTAEYMRNIGTSKIYIVPELSADNEQWINPDFGNPDLQTHYDNIKQMVKEKTGRAMQEKERERKGKNGKIIKVAGCSPIREGVLLIKPDTTLADVKKFGEECQRRWGIAPLQIFLHKDEGHWLSGQPDMEDKESFKVGEKWFKPNYHAHIVFDWMNHDTGKSQKLNDNDMMEMQTLASDILSMKRGQSKTVTGKEHLERNDFIIEKQKEEMNRLDATRQYREYQLEMTNQKMQEAENRTNSLIETANQKERQSEDLDRAIKEKRSKLNREKGSELLDAAVGWATGKSKSLKGEIEGLRHEISTHEETIEQLQGRIQTMQSDHHRELMKLEAKHQSELNRKEAAHTEETARLKNRISWQNQIIGTLSFFLLKTSDIFRKAVNGIIRLAREYYKPRFDAEQVSDIKSALNLFGDDKQSQQTAGNFLYITAQQKGKLDNREQIKARREVDNVVDGHYDQQQKRGDSIRR